MMHKHVNAKQLLCYLECTESTERLTLLDSFAKQELYIDLSLADDLLALGLSDRETAMIVALVDDQDKLRLEDWLTRKIKDNHQDIAIACFERWRNATSHGLWHRLVELCKTPQLPQRLRYMFLYHCQVTGGEHLIKSICQDPQFASYSGAFHALALNQALRYNISDPKLVECSYKYLNDINGVGHSIGVPSAEALLYLMVFDAKTLVDVKESQKLRLPLSLQHLGQCFQFFHAEDSESFIRWDQRDQRCSLPLEEWLRTRPKAAPKPSNKKKTPTVRQPSSGEATLTASVDGCSAEAIETSWLALKNEHKCQSLRHLFERFSLPPRPEVLDACAQLISEHPQPAEIMKALPLRLSLYLNTAPSSPSSWIAEQLTALKAEFDTSLTWSFKSISNNEALSSAYKEVVAELNEISGMNAFMDIAHRKLPGSSLEQSHTFWHKLASCWRSAPPTVAILTELAELARKMPFLLQIPYIQTLGRFHKSDEAILKLLDFMRSPHFEYQKWVFHSLANIGTARAAQELVNSLSRPNTSDEGRLLIVELLQELPRQGVQDELRSCVQDLQQRFENNSNPHAHEIIESIKSLILPGQQDESKRPQMVIAGDEESGAATESKGQGELDRILSQRIPRFMHLSSEVKRALRTAAFFDAQVHQSPDQKTIDLSPIIDMQYKALELAFRECFEDATMRVISRGIVQSKLDIIGYARPIPQKMDHFENQLSQLPVIHSIPYFSKFKMRKMLRALCQFRPGKRFTLDGLKAFAIFFLCFSRQRCTFGLENLFPLPFKSDEQLFEFVKSLHIFQDFRNRAAHEGFQPDAKNNIEGIWQSTAEIFAEMDRIREYLNQSSQRPQQKLRQAG